LSVYYLLFYVHDDLFTGINMNIIPGGTS